jgi:hypothetical protein
MSTRSPVVTTAAVAIDQHESKNMARYSGNSRFTGVANRNISAL